MLMDDKLKLGIANIDVFIGHQMGIKIGLENLFHKKKRKEKHSTYFMVEKLKGGKMCVITAKTKSNSHVS
jgi:hypothetical protein